MTSELHFKLFELLQTAMPKEQAMEAVSVLEKTIDLQVNANSSLASKEDISDVKRRIERLEDKLDKMVYWVAGAILAQSGIIVALLKLFNLVK